MKIDFDFNTLVDIFDHHRCVHRPQFFIIRAFTRTGFDFDHQRVANIIGFPEFITEKKISNFEFVIYLKQNSNLCLDTIRWPLTLASSSLKHGNIHNHLDLGLVRAVGRSLPDRTGSQCLICYMMSQAYSCVHSSHQTTPQIFKPAIHVLERKKKLY